jgi:pimeloyl-ACP methyl ester carboxylesterase
VRAHEAAFAGVPDYLQDAIAAAYLRTAVHREMPAAELEPYVAPWRGAAGKPALYRQIAQMHRRYTDEIEPHLGAVRCPVQLLWGEEDAWIPLDVGRELHRRLGKGAFIPVPNAGHLVQEDAPEAVIAAVDGFLAAPAEAA